MFVTGPTNPNLPAPTKYIAIQVQVPVLYASVFCSRPGPSRLNLHLSNPVRPVAQPVRVLPRKCRSVGFKMVPRRLFDDRKRPFEVLEDDCFVEDSDYDEKKEKQKQKKKEKSDSSASGSEPDEEYDSGGGKSESDDSDKNTQPSPKKNKKPAKAKADTPSKKPRAPRKATKRAKKDPLAPKKAQSAYMIWFQANRKDLAKPGEAVTEVAKRAGATWKGMTDDDKQEWMGRAKKDKERYEKEMKVWKAGASTSAPRASSGGSPTKAKSKEYVASDDSSSDDNKPLAKKGKKKSSGEESTESTPQSDSD